jgi:hypothetical protein
MKILYWSCLSRELCKEPTRAADSILEGWNSRYLNLAIAAARCCPVDRAARVRFCTLTVPSLSALRRPTLENRSDESSAIWDTAATVLSCTVTGVRYGFIPFIVLYAMKKDPRITWGDVISPLPAFDPQQQQQMM